MLLLTSRLAQLLAVTLISWVQGSVKQHRGLEAGPLAWTHDPTLLQIHPPMFSTSNQCLCPVSCELICFSPRMPFLSFGTSHCTVFMHMSVTHSPSYPVSPDILTGHMSVVIRWHVCVCVFAGLPVQQCNTHSHGFPLSRDGSTCLGWSIFSFSTDALLKLNRVVSTCTHVVVLQINTLQLCPKMTTNNIIRILAILNTIRPIM